MQTFIVLRPSKIKGFFFIFFILFFSITPLIKSGFAPEGLTRIPPVAWFLIFMINRVDSVTNMMFASVILYSLIFFLAIFLIYFIACIVGETYQVLARMSKKIRKKKKQMNVLI